MSTTAINILLLVTAVLLASGGQLSMKAGMLKVGEVTREELSDFKGLMVRVIKSHWVVIGVLMFAVSAVFWLLVLSRVKLSIAYPMIAAGYVVVVFFSWLLFKERVTRIGWLGLFLIVAGVIVTAQGL